MSAKRDYTAWMVAITAAILSVGAYVFVALHHDVLQFADASSYLLIGRRVVDGTSPGLAQFGGSWLPGPDMLQTLFVWNTTMYQTGLAGSIWSMAAFIVSCLLLYLIVRHLTGKKVPGIIAAAVFGLSVYTLYLQATPMSELLMFVTMLATIYCLQRWIDSDRFRWLVGMELSALAATIVRYEAWPVAGLTAVMAFVVAWRRPMPDMPIKQRRRRALDRLVTISLICFAGIAAWFAYCQIIFHSALYFVNGQFAKPPVGQNPAIGHLWVAIKTYAYAVIDTISTPVLLLAVLGLVVFVIRAVQHKDTVTRMLPALALLIVIPFYITTIYTGERPLDVVQLAGENYNLRYGLLTLLPAAIFIGYLTSTIRRPKLQIATYVATVAMVVAVGVVTLQQGISNLVGIEHATTASAQAAAAFKKDYTGGYVLMQSWGNEALIKNAVPVNELVDEGSNGLWQPALRSPIHNHITTIVIALTAPDEVRSAVNAGELSQYRETWSNGTYAIYVAKNVLATGKG